MRTRASPTVFLDRDGVIIENRSDYVKSQAEVCFLPRTFAALRQLRGSGYAVVVVTNQSAVGRGIISLEQATAINHHVIAEIAAHGGRVDGCYVCPHRPDERCGCRKPAPGLLLRAAAELGLDLARSYLVGDALTDIAAGRAVGARGVLVLTGRGQEQAALLRGAPAADCPVADDLLAALDYILGAP